MGGLAVVVLLVATPWTLRGRMHRLSEEDLDTARSVWRRSGVRDYDLDVEISGATAGRYSIVVRDGRLQSIERDGRPANPAESDQWTVEGLFKTIDRELQMAWDGARAMRLPEGVQLVILGRFDPTLGYPIDYVRQVTGSGSSVRIRVHGLVQR